MAHFFNTSPLEIEQMDFPKFFQSIDYMEEVNKQQKKDNSG